MNTHSVIKTALGAGLMAASLAASAAIHSFTQPMIYYKVTGAAVNYFAFMPAQPFGAPIPGVVMLDLYNSGSVSSWHYAVGPAPAASDQAGRGWSNAAALSVTQSGYPVSSTSASQTLASALFSFGDTASITLSFVQNPTISSQACNVSFVASIDTNDYLLFTNFTIQPSGFPTASDSVSYRTKSGSAASDTASVASDVWNSSNFSATGAFFTFSAYSIPAAGNATQTVAVSSLTKANLCTAAYTAKNSLNSAGTTLGGKAGLMRLW